MRHRQGKTTGDARGWRVLEAHNRNGCESRSALRACNSRAHAHHPEMPTFSPRNSLPLVPVPAKSAILLSSTWLQHSNTILFVTLPAVHGGSISAIGGSWLVHCAGGSGAVGSLPMCQPRGGGITYKYLGRQYDQMAGGCGCGAACLGGG